MGCVYGLCVGAGFSHAHPDVRARADEGSRSGWQDVQQRTTFKPACTSGTAANKSLVYASAGSRKTRVTTTTYTNL